MEIPKKKKTTPKTKSETRGAEKAGAEVKVIVQTAVPGQGGGVQTSGPHSRVRIFLCIQVQKPCIFHTEHLGLLKKLERHFYLPITVTQWFTLSLITGSKLDPSCAILSLSQTAEEHNSLCWSIPEWPDPSHRETHTREPWQKDLLKFPLVQFNISYASSRFFFSVRVVKIYPKPSTSGGGRSYSSY